MTQRKRKPIGDLPSGVSVRSISNGHGGEYWKVRLGKRYTGGKVIIKYCKTLTEVREWLRGETTGETGATAEKAVLPSVASLKNTAGATAFELTPKQLGEAIAAQKLLTEAKVSATLFDVAKFYLIHTRPEGGEKSIPEVIDALIEAKRKANKKESYLKNLRWPLNKFAEDFAGSMIHEVSRDDFESWLDEEDFSSTTRRNYIRDCSILFNFAKAKKWMNHNPVEGLEKPIVEDREISILTVRQAARLLLTARNTPEFRPYLAPVAIQLFAGVRTSEIKQLNWEQVKEDQIVILASKAKTRQRRSITITPALESWIASEHQESGPVFPKGKCWRRGFTALVEAAKIKPWPRNALRHSFGSYHFALHKNENLTAAEMGNTPEIIFKHYRAVVSTRDAERFWNLINKDANVVPFRLADVV